MSSDKTGKTDFVTIATVQGQTTARILEAHLKCEGIPVLLKYESAGIIYGLTADGIGQVQIMVPRDLADEAKEIIAPQEPGPIDEQDGNS